MEPPSVSVATTRETSPDFKIFSGNPTDTVVLTTTSTPAARRGIDLVRGRAVTGEECGHHRGDGTTVLPFSKCADRRLC
jgi:hypothetical protein